MEMKLYSALVKCVNAYMVSNFPDKQTGTAEQNIALEHLTRFRINARFSFRLSPAPVLLPENAAVVGV